MPNASVPAAEIGLPAFPSDAELVQLGGELEEANGFSARIHRQLRRSLYSIMRVLERMSGERAEEFRSYYLSPALDPFDRLVTIAASQRAHADDVALSRRR